MKHYKNIAKKLTGIILTAAVIMTSVPEYKGEVEAAGDDLLTGQAMEVADHNEVSYVVTYGQTEARAMLSDINTWRTSDTWYWNEDNVTKTAVSGRSALQYDARLEKIAMQRAAEIAISFSHTRPSGEDTWTAYGDIAQYVYVGENIAAGQRNAASAFESWKEEEDDYSGQGHRRNMLNENFGYIGIAHVTLNGTNYWVQEFSMYPSGEAVGDAVDNTAKVTSGISNALLSDVKVVTEQEQISLDLSVNTSCDLPAAETAVLMSKAWPSRYSIVEEPKPEWYLKSGDAITIEGSKIKAVKEGQAVLTASVGLGGKVFSTDCMVNVTSVPGSPTAVPGTNTEITGPSIIIKTPTPTSKPSTTNKPTATRRPSATGSPINTKNYDTVITSNNDSVKKVGSVSLKNKKGKKISVSWKKVSGATKYQIQCSLNNKFTKLACNTYVKKNKYLVKYLKKKKTYYVRVRAMNNSYSFGKWSSVKKIKIKR